MNKFLQICCYAVSFALLLWMGAFFQFLEEDESYRLMNLLPGKPLPGVTLLMLHNHFALLYCLLLPWLAFVGIPLAPFAKLSYWDEIAFLMRFAVFLIVEIALLCFMVTAWALPYIGIIPGMSEGGPTYTWIEIGVRGLFWFWVVLLLIAFFIRILRKPKAGSQHPTAVNKQK